MQAHNSKNEQTQCMLSVFLNSDSFHFVVPLVVWEKENPSERVLELHIFFLFLPFQKKQRTVCALAKSMILKIYKWLERKKKKKRKKGKKAEGKKKRREINSREEFSKKCPSPALSSFIRCYK